MKRRKTNGGEAKVPKNLYLSKDTLKQGKQLVEEEKRGSFGNVVEWLISQEWERRFGKVLAHGQGVGKEGVK
jgi:hypothetical protein